MFKGQIKFYSIQFYTNLLTYDYAATINKQTDEPPKKHTFNRFCLMCHFPEFALNEALKLPVNLLLTSTSFKDQYRLSSFFCYFKTSEDLLNVYVMLE